MIESTDIYILARDLYRLKKQKDKEKYENSYEDEFFNLLFERLKNKILYVDSNIFMAEPNEAIDRFFKELTLSENIKITMPTEQYEEIYKLKKGDAETAKAARDAFRRMEKLIDSKHIDIPELKEMPDYSPSYADPIFMKMILEDLKNDKQVYFITEDKDLKIRLKSKIIAEKLNENNIVICSFESLYSEKYNIVDEQRERKKKEEETDKFLADLQNDSFKDKAINKIASFIDN